MGQTSLDNPTPSPEILAAWSTHIGRQVRDAAALRRELTSGPTLHGAFSATARRFPGAKALTIDGVTLTHYEVEEESARVAALLTNWGIHPGTRVTMVADSNLSVVTAYLGALRVGAVVTFAHASYTVPELARVLAVSHAVVAMATGDSLVGLVEAAPDCRVIGLEASDRSLVTDVLAAKEPSSQAAVGTDGDSTAILALTSGTTGEPKLVPLSHRNLLSSIRGVIWAWRWSSKDRLVHSLPIGHQHGLGAIHAALLTGSHAIILPRFDPSGLINAVDEHEASALFAVPAIYERLLAEAPKKMEYLSRLRLMTSGSAPLPTDLAERVEAVTGQLPVERYGLTESGLDVSNPYDGPRIPGTVGLALPGVELAVVDSDGQRDTPGGTGEVVLRGPQVFHGYLDREEARGAFIGDWFRTGDIGTIDETTGHLRLIGRSKDLIITGGMNVYPREVEAVLLAVPGVIDAAVIGVPSQSWGEAVTAFVVSAGVSPDEIATAIATDLARFKRPKQIIQVASIPRTEMGKLRGDLLLSSPQISPS
jgi:malonyl-CoA/methylmalonyl-CoA synthetase